jgi:choline kinase
MQQKLDAVILAAGMGSRISQLSKVIPKGFIQVNEETLIERSLRLLNNNNFKTIYIVTGYKKMHYEQLAKRYTNVITINNYKYSETGSFGSFLKVAKYVHDSFLLLESDLLYEEKILKELISDRRKNIIATSDHTNSGDEIYVKDDDSILINMSKNKNLIGKESSEFVGINKISFKLFNYLISNYSNEGQKEYEELLVMASKKNDIYVKKINDVAWCEIDTLTHLKRAKEIIYPLLNK